MGEGRNLTWRNHISQNKVNLRLKRLHKAHREFEAETFTQSTSRIYLQPVKFSTLDPSLILRYSECTKMTSFSLLGFCGPGSN